ncbi:UNVERIFIED_CONTAM: hypothetical protein K2H54_069250 [Gekko kuhli]
MRKPATLKSPVAAMAAARKGVYWLDEEVEMMLEALVDLEAGEYFLVWDVFKAASHHAPELIDFHASQLGHWTLALRSASAQTFMDPGHQPASKHCRMPGVVHRVEVLEKSFKSLKTSVDTLCFNVFIVKQGMKSINQTLTEMKFDWALEQQQREDRGDEVEEEEVEEQHQVEVDPEGNAEEGGSPMQ